MRRLPPLVLLALGACATAPPAVEIAAPDVKPIAVELHRDHGWAALRAERYAEAAPYFKRILKERPEDSQATLGLGESFLGQGRFEDALAQFQRIDDRAPLDLKAKALQGQGLAWLRLGDRVKALGLLEQAIERDPSLWRSWSAIGRLRDAEKDFPAARYAFREAIRLNPKAGHLHNNLGFSLLASGELVYAEASLRKALELDPNLAVAAANLRLALALQGRYGPALAGASAAERAAVMNNVGFAALLRGDREKARALFLDALAANPGFFGEAQRNLAFLETLESGETSESDETQ
jgi:Flp pilus assembly protein TadD